MLWQELMTLNGGIYLGEPGSTKYTGYLDYHPATAYWTALFEHGFFAVVGGAGTGLLEA